MPTGWMPIECDRVCSFHFDPAVITRRGSRVGLLECGIPRIAAYEQDSKSEGRPSIDHAYALPNPVTLKRRLDVLMDKVQSNAKKPKSSHKRETRLRLTLAPVINDLKKEHVVNEEMHVKLQAFSDIPTNLFNRQIPISTVMSRKTLL